MVKWILKRTLLIFIIWIVSTILILTGGGICIIGMIIASIWIFIAGVIVGLLGVFLRMFSHALTKWIEVKMGDD